MSSFDARSNPTQSRILPKERLPHFAGRVNFIKFQARRSLRGVNVMRWSLPHTLLLLWLAAGCAIGPSAPETEEEPDDTSAVVSNLLTDILERDGDFTQFARALESTGLGDVLRGNGPFTVFAPSDSTFELIAGFDLEGLSEEDALSFLKYHIVAGDLTGNGTENTPWATTLASERLHFAYEHQAVVIDGITEISRADNTADNGRFHRIDLPLLPDSILATLSLADVIAASPRLGKLEAALSQITLLPELDSLSDATFFAMSDKIIRDSTIDLDALDETQLTDLLSDHLVDEALDSDALAELSSITSRSGQEHPVQSDSGITLDNRVNVLWEDLVVSNGVLHIVDGILGPENGQ